LLFALVFTGRHALPPGAVAAAVVLIGMTFTEMAISSLVDFMDIQRHHLLFFALLDMMVLWVVYLSARWIGNGTDRSAAGSVCSVLEHQRWVARALSLRTETSSPKPKASSVQPAGSGVVTVG